MSRVDEAFKRASGLMPQDGEAAERATAVAHHLQAYPPEAGTGAAGAKTAHGPVPRLAAVSFDTEPMAPLQPAERSAPPDLPAGFVGRLITSPQADPMAAEQYRRLAGAIHEIQLERGLKTLMVTSSIPHEGKTLTVSNLALTLSGSYGRQVLLIDADLRRPMVHDVFGVDNSEGLGDVLAAPDGELPLRKVSERLTILPAGRVEQPMERLTSDAMRLLLEQCSATFDWVLLDAPPVGMMPDARLLAGLTRAVLFVIAARSTPHDVVSRALGEFDPDSLIGTVLNRVQELDIPAQGYYRDYYSSARESVRLPPSIPGKVD